jgi:hypothetical protein
MNNQNKPKIEPTTEIASPASPLMKIDRSLSNIFGSEPMAVSVVTPKGEIPMPVETADMTEVDTDASVVRSNLHELLQQGQDALQYAIDLAKQSDSPRAFEVVGTLMSNLAAMNMQLMDSHEKKAKIKANAAGRSDNQQAHKVVNNSIVFSGSTAELNAMLNNMKKDQ